ncbi:MAG: molybdopterin molybdotransferase MoeA [Vulcanimicrobiaceae bacterium]
MRDAETLSPQRMRDGRTVGFEAERLLAPDAAVALYLTRVRPQPVGVEGVALAEAAGRILAAEARADDDVPAHDRSTMDGFALRSAEARPGARLRIAGAIAMGAPPPRALGPGEAFRIPTGGALPEGADAVVPLEDVVESDDTILLSEALDAGDAVAPRAGDIQRGECVLAAGRRLGGPELGVLATLGIVQVPVFRRPRIAVISTGDELVGPALRPAVGQVRDSNRYALGAALEALGASPVHFPSARDDAAALRAALEPALAGCDALLLTGGTSVGGRDLVPAAVAELGAPGVVVHGLRVKPGKPTLLAAVGRKPVLGLPGNPTSSLAILEAVLRPIVAALTGERDAEPLRIPARAAAPFEGRAGWTWFVPAALRVRPAGFEAVPLAIRSSHTSLLARAAGYVVVGPERWQIPSGAPLELVRFSGGGAPPEREP